MNKIKREEGITLTALVVTILIIFIISAISLTAGFETADNLKIKKFNDELQIVQARVDVIYEKIKNGERTVQYIEDEEDKYLGGESYKDEEGNIHTVMERTFNDLNEEGINREDYRYYTKKAIEKYLDIDGITQSVLINWKTRDVISVEGIKVDGVRTYRYEGAFQPTYTEESGKNITVTATSENKGDIKKVLVRVTLEDNSDIEINDFILKYKLENENVWKIADYNYFETVILGNYNIQVSGNGINTVETDILLE